MIARDAATNPYTIMGEWVDDDTDLTCAECIAEIEHYLDTHKLLP